MMSKILRMVVKGINLLAELWPTFRFVQLICHYLYSAFNNITICNTYRLKILFFPILNIRNILVFNVL